MVPVNILVLLKSKNRKTEMCCWQNLYNVGHYYGDVRTIVNAMAKQPTIMDHGTIMQMLAKLAQYAAACKNISM